MIYKIISVFLIFMVILAIFGRLRFPKLPGRTGMKRCPDCGRPLIGKAPCGCGGKA